MHQQNKLYTKHVLGAIALIKDHIDQHPLERKTTTELSVIACVNRNTLQKAFKEVYGEVIKEYQFKKRMEIACARLKEGRLNIKQIASECGYENPNNFSSAFKKLYKVPPSEWQELNC